MKFKSDVPSVTKGREASWSGTPPIVSRRNCLVVAMAMMALWFGSALEAGEKPVDVLVLSAGMTLDSQLVEQFAKEEVKFVTRKLSDPLSPEMLRQFHVVLIADWEGPNITFCPQSLAAAALTTIHNLELLRDYISAGGGFFFTPMNGSQMASESLSGFLKPYGAGVLSAQVRDDAHAYTNLKREGRRTLSPPDYFEYAWTTAMTSHPATQGVERIFYPTSELRWDDLYSTPVVVVDAPAWTVLVKGMETSRPSKGVDYYNWHAVGDAPPVIAAARAFGDGRMAVFTPSYLHTLAYPFSSPRNGWILEAHTGKIDGVFLDKGDGANPSHGRKLMLGMLRWLAETARTKGMGGYEKTAFAALPVPRPAPSPGWLYSWKPGDGNRWFKLLVGARSSFSDGKGTVEDYAKAARASGVAMLFMTESFEHFAPARWQEYRAACAKASDASLKVVPGLEIPDAYGNRYLLLGSPAFPAPNLLTSDGKALAKPQYLCLCFPKAITVQHRATTSQVPHELHKHFQGVSVFTYRNGALEDNSLPAYEWQVFRFSNPLPFVVHETYSPADLAKEASTGHQLYGSADNLSDLAWYLGEHGTSHFWESPTRLQISAGPMITAWGGSAPNPAEPAAMGDLSFAVKSDEPLKEVALWENFNLLRRWTPNSKDFAINNVKLPEGHANWVLLTAVDVKGRMAVSPGMAFGRQVVHTWRCGDRQNWWSFPNIYAGTDLADLDLRVPVGDGTAEGSGLFPEMHGPQRGDNLAALLDFSLASPAAYVQDVFVDQRYPKALFDDAAYDAKPANATVRSRVYEAKVRYHLYWPNRPQGKSDYLPLLKEIEISLRKPVEPSGDVFPMFTTLAVKHAQVSGDMRYSYLDPASGKLVSGKLERGFVDLPKGGCVGGLIALSDGVRVTADGQVGFAPPLWRNGALPVGTTWRAAFTTVPPAEAERWLNLMGFRGDPPFSLAATRGALKSLAYVATCEADNYAFGGSVAKAMDAKLLRGFTSGQVNDNGEGKGVPLVEYRLPMTVAGVNYNWPAALVRDGMLIEEVPVFEGKAYARLDVTKPGDFHVGNVILSDAPNLRVALLRWTADACELELNNPASQDLDATVWTAPQVVGRFAGKSHVKIKAGSSLTVKLQAAGGQ